MTRSDSDLKDVFAPVLDDAERTVVLMKAADAAYDTYCRGNGLPSNWEAVPFESKMVWCRAVKAGVRVMFFILSEAFKDEEQNHRDRGPQ